MKANIADTHSPDPAGVFAAANSLWNAIFEESTRPEKLSLSDYYQGLDQLMREVMRVGTLFETWCCRHVAFDELDEVWPYFIADNFGPTWTRIEDAYSLAAFNERDCLRAAWYLGVPIRISNEFVLPLAVRAQNPTSTLPFTQFWIRTTQTSINSNDTKLFTVFDDLFDKRFSTPCYSLYGDNTSGDTEHIASRATYQLIASFASRLIPNVAFPSEVVCRRGA